MSPRRSRLLVAGRKSSNRERHRLRLAGLVPLEDRTLLATLAWVGDVDNLWNTNVAGDTNWSNDALPASGDTLVFGSTAANLTNVNDTTAGNTYDVIIESGAYSISGNAITLDGTGVSTLQPGSVTLTTPLTIASAAFLITGSGAILRLGGSIQGGAAGTLLINGQVDYIQGTASPNPFAGSTTINAGELRLNTATSDRAISGPLIVGNTLGPAGSAVVTLQAGSQIADNAAVTVLSDGLFTSFGENLGDFTVLGGRVSTGGNSGLAPFGMIRLDGATVDGTAPFFTSGNAVESGSTLGTSTISAPVNLSGTTTFNATDGPTGSDSLVISGPISGGGIIKEGLGTLVLSGANTFIGEIVITEGILEARSDSALGSSAGGTRVDLFAILGLSGGVTIPDEPLTLNQGTLRGGAGSNTFGGMISNDTQSNISVDPDSTLTLTGDTTGVGEIWKQGDGRLTIAPGAVFDVKTNLFRGLLRADGTIGEVVFSGQFAQLEGVGTAGPISTTGIGGAITPGTSPGIPGILSTGDIAIGRSVFIGIDVNGPGAGVGHDQIAVGGFVSLNDAFLGLMVGLGPFGSAPLVILDNDGVDPINGQFTDSALGLPIANGEIITYGPQRFRLRYDGGDGNDVTIQAVDAPVAEDDIYGAVEETPLVVGPPGILGNDTDVNGDQLVAVLLTGPSNGTLTLNGDGSFTYLPSPNFSGTDSFTYRAFDGTTLPDGTPDPDSFSNAATVTIFVNAVNDPPITNPDVYLTDEDTPLAVNGPGVLANDASPEGLPISAVLVTGPSHASSFLLAPNGSFSYVPAPNFNGLDSFTYRARDANGLAGPVTTVSIVINPVSDPGNPVDDAFSVAENQVLFVAAPGVLANDTDPDNTVSELWSFLISGPSNGALLLDSNGSFTYTSNANFSGTDTFTYRISDGESLAPDTATVTITVRPGIVPPPVNVPPTAVADSYSSPRDDTLVVPAPGVLGNDFDNNTDPTSAVLVQPPQSGTLQLNSDGSFTYLPNGGFVGTDTFTYRASDGTLLSTPATVTITVTPIATTTLRLAPGSDTGVSPFDGITSDDTPTFLGTGVPGLNAQLFVRPLGSTEMPANIGGDVIDTAGNFVITTPTLPDGDYQFFILTARDNGQIVDLFLAAQVTVDTVAPRVVGTFLSPRTGQVYSTFQDDRTGLAASTLANINNYGFSKLFFRNVRDFLVTAATPLPAFAATDPQTVVIDIANNRRLPHARYLFAILAGGIADVAGNPLDGEYNGTYPSGDGFGGGNFLAQFNSNGRTLTPASPTSEFVPIVFNRPPAFPPPLTASTSIVPAGPLASRTALGRRILASRARR